MHQNISLWSASDNQNLFQGSGRLGLSKMGEQFVAGLVKHAEALCALVCPSVNSYKRYSESNGYHNSSVSLSQRLSQSNGYHN